MNHHYTCVHFMYIFPYLWIEFVILLSCRNSEAIFHKCVFTHNFIDGAVSSYTWEDYPAIT